MTQNYFEQARLSRLPGYARLFVGLVTVLMLFVCVWAVWIFYESQGKPDPDHLPAYLKQPADIADSSKAEPGDLSVVPHESSAGLVPAQETTICENERPLRTSGPLPATESDSTRLPEDDYGEVSESGGHESPFRENLGLAHTHINGQTLLYFVMGFFFLFTSVSPKLKKTLYWVFGIAVLAHAIGLTGRGFHWVYDDLLAVSGFTILAVMGWMGLLIIFELVNAPRK